MKAFLQDILKHPNKSEPLSISGNFLTSNSEDKFEIIDNIPVLRPLEKREIEIKSKLHLDFESGFDYSDHYDLDAKVIDYFEKYTCSATNDEFKRIHQAIISRVPKNAELILDVGCGSAWVAEHFLPKGKKVISMDISIDNPKKALQYYPSENHSAIIADAFYLPLEDNSVDCIIASEIIEHVLNPEEFIKSLLRVIKPGGKLIITTPYNETLEYQLCVHCNRPTTKHAHLYSFNEKNFKEIIPDGKKWDYLIFGNKFLGRLRTHYFLGWMPFKLWRVFDVLSSLIKYKPIRFLIEIKK